MISKFDTMSTIKIAFAYTTMLERLMSEFTTIGKTREQCEDAITLDNRDEYGAFNYEKCLDNLFKVGDVTPGGDDDEDDETECKNSFTSLMIAKNKSQLRDMQNKYKQQILQEEQYKKLPIEFFFHM